MRAAKVRGSLRWQRRRHKWIINRRVRLDRGTVVSGASEFMDNLWCTCARSLHKSAAYLFVGVFLCVCLRRRRAEVGGRWLAICRVLPHWLGLV